MRTFRLGYASTIFCCEYFFRIIYSYYFQQSAIKKIVICIHGADMNIAEMHKREDFQNKPGIWSKPAYFEG